MDRHGTNQGWLNGCRCDECFRGRKQFRRKRRRTYQGTNKYLPNDLVDAAPMKARMSELFELGHNYASLSVIAGLPYDTVRNSHRSSDMSLNRGYFVTIRTAHKVMSVPRTPTWDMSFNWQLPGDLAIDVTGTMRRLRALAYIGYTCRDVADETKTNDRFINRIRNGDDPRVTLSSARCIKTFYDWALVRDAPSGTQPLRTRNLSRKRGWLGPGAWDNIDDPDSRIDEIRRERRR